ncbi:hypothetical protein PR202_gb06416 [Eleusine coracana subsp. coracana]|uniref:protein-serine/threonine phosphatase n=1 Tax=Eleusine coracana subsp. coracana TaxID=191504 RepID=A0AAV5E8S6_ELECO|nr:hypothetical protein PR202_gb06416 [Eleusine coracana subsp. coracana]
MELCDDDDVLVVACDVIWVSDNYNLCMWHNFQEKSLSAVCERVFDRCLAPSTIGGHGCDNMTMILVQFQKPVNMNIKAEVTEGSTGSTNETEIPVETGS